MNRVKLGDTKIEIIDGDRSKNYPSKSDFLKNGFCIFLDASNVTKSGFNLENPLFISKEKSDLMRNGKLKKDDIVITTRGTVGNLAHYDEDVNLNYKNIRINSGMLIIRNPKDFNTKYLYYLFKSDIIAEQIRQKTTGSSQPQITVGILNELILLIPPLPTQTAIARVLSSFDDKIELNNKINNELENLAKTIYEYWFVQNANNKWEKKRLGEIGVNVIRGVTYNKNDIKTANDKNVVGILRATNINGNIIDLDNLVYVDKFLISENQKLQLFDILITMSSGSKEHVGKNGLFCFDNVNVAFGAFCSKIDVEEEYKFYIYEHFQSEKFKNHVKSCCLGTNINNLNNEIIKDISITIPPTPILQKFNKNILPIFSIIIKNRQENLCLTQLRDFLLPLLMNGQVTVKAIESKTDIIPFKNQDNNEQKFNHWKQDKKYAARGETDLKTLREIFDSMDDDDK